MTAPSQGASPELTGRVTATMTISPFTGKAVPSMPAELIGEGLPMPQQLPAVSLVAVPYYATRPRITKERTESSTGLSIPAAKVEQLVTSRIRQWLLDPGNLYQATWVPDLAVQRRVVAGTAEIGRAGPSCREDASVPSSLA